MSNDTPASFNPYTAPSGDLTTPISSDEKILAGRGARLGAGIIDAIIISCLTLLPIILFFGGWGNYAAAIVDASILLRLVLLAIGIAAYLLINGHLLAKNGQTIGKKLLGIKIVRTDGSAADFTRIVLRRVLPVQLIQLVPTVGSLLILVDVLFIFRESKKCLHDDIADTIVIKA